MSLTTRTDTPILSVASLSTEEMQANASDSDDQARQQASEVGNIQVEDTSISVKLFQEPDILQSTAVYHDMQSASDDITDLLDKSIIASKYTDKHPLPSKAEGDTDLQTEPPKLEEGSKSGESCHLHFDDEGHHRTNVTKELPAMSPSDVCIPGGNGIASKTQGQDALVSDIATFACASGDDNLIMMSSRQKSTKLPKVPKELVSQAQVATLFFWMKSLRPGR